MAIFKDSQELIQVLSGFFRLLADDPQVGPKLMQSKLKLQFNYREPDASLFIDLSGNDIQITANPQGLTPDVEMSMKAETAHKFWQGKVNLVMALTRREITAKGPIPKILKLLPIIKPAYALYPSYLVKINFS